jgi:hypothetical protein
MMSLASEVVHPVSISVLILWSFQSVFIHPSILRRLLFKFHHGMEVRTLSIPSLYRLCSPPINSLAIIFFKNSPQYIGTLFWEWPTSNCQPMAGVFTTAWHHKNPCKATREYNLRRKEYEKAPHMTTLHGRSLIIII